MRKLLFLLALLMTSLMSWAETTEEVSNEDKTLTITVNEVGGLYSWASAKLGGGNSSAYSTVNYVKIKTAEGVSLSYSGNDNDLSAVSYFTTQNLSSLKRIDFSEASFDNEGYNTIKTHSLPQIDLVLKNGTTANDLVTLYDNGLWSAGNLYSLYTQDNENILAAHVQNYPARLANGADLDAGCTSLVLTGFKGSNYMTTDVINAINAYKTVQNLVLMEGGNANQTIFNSSTFDFTPIDNNIKRIILSIGSDVNDDNKFIFSSNDKTSSIKVVQACKTHGTEMFTDIRVLEAGALSDVAHYRNSTINNAFAMKFYGEYNVSDIIFIENINNDKFDLSSITYTSSNTGVDMESEWKQLNFNTDHSGQYDKMYVLLPDFGKNPDDALFTSIRNNNNNRISIGHYYATDTYFTAWSQNNGDVEVLTSMLDTKSSIKKAKLSGNLCAKDIGYGSIVLTDGHLKFDKEAEESTDANSRALIGESTQCAFSSQLTELDLSDAMFADGDKVYTEDITFSKLNILDASQSDVNIGLPTNSLFTEIPAFCLSIEGSKIKEIHIPSNIEKIRTAAFYGCSNLNHITTDDGNGNPIDYSYGYKQDEKGENYTEELDKEGSGSYAFSANLKLIESYAFYSANNVKDVYCLAKDAPECHKDAFPSLMCGGNNGYSLQGVVTRKDYYNGDWIAVLHFPADVDETNEKRYTDVTRDYSIADSDGTLDERGKLLYWPSQTEFNRSYTQASNGFLWNAWSTERTAHTYTLKVNPNDYNIAQKEANNLYTGTSESVFYDTSYTDNGSTVAGVTEDYNKTVYDKDYRGWHQFVLSNYGTSKEYTPKFSFDITDDNWWTICLPFGMTKAELYEIFGNSNKNGEDAYPDVRELVGVTRNGTTRTITLNFGSNIVFTKNDGTTTADDDAVIVAGHPYLIKPAVADGTNDAFERESNTAMDNSQLETMLKEQMVTVTARDENNKETDYKYTFIGNFYKWYIPQYSYFLGWDSKVGKPAFFYHNEMITERSWNPYTAVIAPNWDNPVFVKPSGLESVHWYTSDQDVSVLKDDSFPTSEGGSARPYSIVMDFDNNTVTGITEINSEKNTVNTATRVYTLNGQYVGTSTKSLPKGIYIVEGKKTVVY